MIIAPHHRNVRQTTARLQRPSVAVMFAWLLIGPLSIPVHSVLADCALLHESFQGLSSINANGGVQFGPLTFEPAVNSNGVRFGSGHVRYHSPEFQLASGSLSFWIRKTSADESGGVLQIGELGEANSIGVFYISQSQLVFELRNNTGDVVQANIENTLSQVDWMHVTLEWRNDGNASSLLVFVNGVFATGSWLAGAFVPSSSDLHVGRTGYYGNGECLIDELRCFDWPLHDGEAWAEYVYSARRFVRQTSPKPVSTGPVRITDGRLYVHNRPFRVKGVGYAPTPIGEWPGSANASDPGILERDMPLLRGMHVNTIRTWAQTPDSSLLDACYNGGVDPIYVIMGYWVPLDEYTDYSDPADIAAIESGFRTVIRQFKDHPSLLAWGLGNENNYAYQGDVADWFALAERLAEIAYEEEGPTYHPTIIINADMRYMGDVQHGSDDASMPYVDVWGNNVYLGDAADCYFDYFHRLTAKPFLATEYGIDALDHRTHTEYEAVQAQWVVAQWRRIKEAGLGGSIMAYSDEWWKAGDPTTQDDGGYATTWHPDGFSNEEWWGMLRPVDNGDAPDIMQPRQVYYAMAAEYVDTNGDHDVDDDVDLRDFAEFQRCFAAPATGHCACFEFVVDGIIDQHDAAGFLDCYGGAGQPPLCSP